MTLYPTNAREWRDDAITASRFIHPRLLTNERDLAAKKWFAYRFATPWNATQHFADLYIKGFRTYIRFHGDSVEADKCRGLTLRIFTHANRCLTQLWQARQRADELGLPYDLLIAFGFEFAGRRKRRRAPTPLQLFSNEKTAEVWSSKLSEFMNSRLPMALRRLSGIPQYRTEHYRGLPAQDDFRTAIVNLLAQPEGSWSAKIGTACVRERFLPYETSINLVPEHMREGVRADIVSDQNIGILTPEPLVELAPISFLPPCAGLPAARNPSTDACSRCAISRLCATMVKAVNDEMFRKHASVSPIKDAQDKKRKAGQNRRQAKFRARRRELAAAASPGLSV